MRELRKGPEVTRRLIRSIAPVLRLIALAWHRRALAEMGADHPDVPYVVLRIRQLENAK